MAEQVIVKVWLKGAIKAVDNLKQLEKNARRRVVSAAVRAGNKIVLREARAAAPVKTGALRDSLRASLRFYSDTGRVVSHVKLGRLTKAKAKRYRGNAELRDIPYWLWVIKGTPPHDIPGGFKSFKERYDTRKREMRTNPALAAAVVADKRPNAIAIAGQPLAGVLHPGAKPNTFLRTAADRAFKQAVAETMRAFGEKMNAEVQKVRAA